MPKLKVIVLGSGYATRMRPLSLNRVKCMQSVLGRPLLEYLIHDLCAAGFKEVIISTRGRAGEVDDWFGNGTNYGMHIDYHESETWRGTAGTARHIVDELGQDADTFLIIYGDSLLRADFAALLHFHQTHDQDCTILVHHPDFSAFLYESSDSKDKTEEQRTNYGVLELASDNRVLRIVEKPKLIELANFTNPAANAAVYILPRELMERIPRDKTVDFVSDIFGQMVSDGQPCYAFDIGKGYRLDLGTLPNYYTVQIAILEGSLPFDFFFPQIRQGIWIGSGAVADLDNTVQPPLLLGNASQVGSGAHLSSSIIGSNVEICSGATIERSIILDGTRIGSGARVIESIVGDHCFLDGKVLLPPHSVLGSYCHLGGATFRVNAKQFQGMVHTEGKEVIHDRW